MKDAEHCKLTSYLSFYPSPPLFLFLFPSLLSLSLFSSLLSLSNSLYSLLLFPRFFFSTLQPLSPFISLFSPSLSRPILLDCRPLFFLSLSLILFHYLAPPSPFSHSLSPLFLSLPSPSFPFSTLPPASHTHSPLFLILSHFARSLPLPFPSPTLSNHR